METPPVVSPLTLRLSLLTGQSFLIGIASATLTVVANTLFLVDWGAAWLPWTYLGNALFVPAVSYGVIQLQQRWATSRIALLVGCVFTGLIILARLLLFTRWAAWVSPFLMVNSALGGLLVAVVIGGLAGSLLEIREMKRFFPTIRAGLSSGYVVGNMTVPLLVVLLDGVENLILVIVISLLLMLLILLVMITRFRAALAISGIEQHETAGRGLALRLKQRYSVHIFFYRTLNTVGPLLVFFVLMSAAESRFATADGLASFLGILNGVSDIATALFAVLAVGWLLSRFGLRIGLTATGSSLPLAILLMLVVGFTTSVDGPLFFWLLVGGNTLFIIFLEGMTLPALKTVYQALPVAERQAVETAADGICVPLANGLAGLLLLALNAVPGLTALHILVLALVLSTPQVWVGGLVYRGYRAALTRALSRRALDNVELVLNDGENLAVVETLLHSTQLAEVRLALDLLEKVDHPSLPARLVEMVRHDGAAIQIEGLLRIARYPGAAALPAVEACLRSAQPPAVKGAALRALCALQGSDSVESVVPHLTDPAADVRLGALVGLLKEGGIAGIVAAGLHLTAAARSSDPAEKILTARVIGEVKVNSFCHPLIPLLEDDNLAVRQAALAAAQQVAHPRLLPLLVANLAHHSTRAAAMAALVASGEYVLPLVTQALTGAVVNDRETVRRLVRVGAQVKGERLTYLFQQHLDHPESEIQCAVLIALHRSGYRASLQERERIERTLRTCVCHGLRRLFACHELGEQAATAPLYNAMRAELADIRQGVFLLLALLYEARALLRVAERLRRGTTSERALALESLDVTLEHGQKGLVLPLVDESQPISRRVERLNKHFALPSLERTARLAEIISDTTAWPQPWTRACAIYAAGTLRLRTLTCVIAQVQTEAEPIVVETVTWALAVLKSTPEQNVEDSTVSHADPVGAYAG